MVMENYGRNRRPGGAVYELLTVDTSGDDEEVGKHEERGEDLALAAKGKGKRRKHKSRKMQSLGFGAVLGEDDLGGGAGAGAGEVSSSSSLGIVSLVPQPISGVVLATAGDGLSFKALIAPRPDGILADLRLERRISVKELSGLESKGDEFKETTQEFPFQASAAAEAEAAPGANTGQKSPSNTESLRSLATGVASPGLLATDLVLLKSDSMIELSSPISKELRASLGHEIRPGLVPSLDANVIENASTDGRVPDLRLMSPKDRLSGRTSPVATGIGSISGYSPRGGSQREPLFSSGSVAAELRQRAVEKSPEPPVQENGVDGGAKAITRVVSFKKQKPEADSSYLGHVDVVEQPSGYRTLPLPRPDRMGEVNGCQFRM
jgi:hypothetical protein